MITRITGVLTRVLDEEIRLEAPPFEYQLLVPEFLRRVLQLRLGEQLRLHTLHYLDGDPSRGKVVPRLVGFEQEVEMEFFELFCTVDKIGTKKALKALARPIRDIADAIQRGDAKWLSTLPGVGGPTAEKIVATLKRKVTRYAVLPSDSSPSSSSATAPTPSADKPAKASKTAAATESSELGRAGVVISGQVIDDTYMALMAMGNSPQDARTLLDRALTSGKSFSSVQEMIAAIYARSA
ncbi:MAG: Holliday junction branch migration protein RuvA [Gemmataceae bacterium]